MRQHPINLKGSLSRLGKLNNKRSLKGVKKKQCDVMIIDHNGSECLKYCIPKECSSSIVKIHQAMPFVKSFSFFGCLFKSIIKYGFNASSLLSAIILELKPKVIITFIDNNAFMGELQSFFPDMLVISIQNGIRGPGFQEHEAKILSYPHYFGFGDYEFETMQKSGKMVKKYYSYGSFKMGIFLTNFYKSTGKDGNAKNICLISQWHNVGVSKLFDQYLSVYQETCKLLSRFSKENDIEVIIATRKGPDSKDSQREELFFKNIFGRSGVSYSINDRLNMTSYQVGMNANLIIGFDSTLMFEALGLEKKILCCGYVNKDFSSIFGNENQCSSLPSEILLNNMDYNEFKNKVHILLEMDDSEYANKIEDARKYYMNFESKYPHQVIHNMIQEKCKQ